MDWDKESIKRLYAAIGVRIRRARKKQGLTQEELATAIKLTRSSIANVEAGRQQAPAHVVVLIAQALDVPVESLVPSGSELDKLVNLQPPTLDLEGHSETTHDFVTAALRRATGG